MDLYAVLGVDNQASDAAIKQAYRKLARQYHPDVNQAADAAKKFNDIQEAYSVLSDPQKRRQYDQFGTTSDAGNSGFGGFGGFGASTGAASGAAPSHPPNTQILWRCVAVTCAAGPLPQRVHVFIYKVKR